MRIHTSTRPLESWKQHSSNDPPRSDGGRAISQVQGSADGGCAGSSPARLENASGTDSPKRPWMPSDPPFLPGREQIGPSIRYNQHVIVT